MSPNHAPARRRPRAARGFTLMELTVVLAIIAVLAALAYPSYLDTMRKGWRAEARTALMHELQQQERFYTQRARYKATVFRSESGERDGAGRYALMVGLCEGQVELHHCIRLTAAPRNGFADPQVGDLWLDSRGEKGCSGTASPQGCWP